MPVLRAIYLQSLFLFTSPTSFTFFIVIFLICPQGQSNKVHSLPLLHSFIGSLHSCIIPYSTSCTRSEDLSLVANLISHNFFAMKTTTSAFLLVGVAAHQAAATWDFFASPFLKTPRYNNNECDAKQRSGFDWADLQAGDKDFKYGDFDFSGGWSCSNSIGKRDHLSRRTFGTKVIKNTVGKDKPASFSCSQRTSGFSVTELDISVQFDTELELHYNMPDGSKCKQYSSCSQGGTTVKNTQCGGAKSVDVYLGSHYKGSESQCEIGLHRIDFDCDSGDKYTPPASPETPATSSSVESSVVSTSQSIETSTAACYGAEGECNGLSTPQAPTPPATEVSSQAPIETPPSSIAYSTAAPYTNSSVSIVTPSPESSTVVTSSPAQESSVLTSACGYGGACEDSTIVSSASAPASTGISTLSSSTIQASPSGPSYSPASPPAQLPSCMNTWLQISTQCKDNTDKRCYCVNADFTKNVIDCVSAWCGTDEETKSALQYLIGICAEHVPENPKIIEDCPTYIPLSPTPATPTGGVTVGVSTTMTLSGTPAAETPCTTITYGSSSTITVPLVYFSTQTNVAGANPTEPVGLVPGTAPAQTPAATTGALYPTPSTMGTRTASAGMGTGTGGFRPSSPAEFTGAASHQGVPPHVMLGAALAFWVL